MADKPRYSVHYYDPKRKGTWVREFDSQLEAEEFAKGKRVYSKPCQVVEGNRVYLNQVSQFSEGRAEE